MKNIKLLCQALIIMVGIHAISAMEPVNNKNRKVDSLFTLSTNKVASNILKKSSDGDEIINFFQETILPIEVETKIVINIVLKGKIDKNWEKLVSWFLNKWAKQDENQACRNIIDGYLSNYSNRRQPSFPVIADRSLYLRSLNNVEKKICNLESLLLACYDYDFQAAFAYILNSIKCQGVDGRQSHAFYDLLSKIIKYDNEEKIILFLNIYRSIMDYLPGEGLTYKQFREESLLHIAARHNRLSIMELLIKLGFNVNSKSKRNIRPIHVACLQGNLEATMLLLNNGASLVGSCLYKEEDDRKLYNISPIFLACKSGNKELFEALLSFIYKPTKSSKSPKKRQKTRENYVKATENNGDTLLHIAVREGYKDIVKMLLSNGADPNAKNDYWNTPLLLACQSTKADADIVSMLLEASGNTDVKNRDGNTCLLLACKSYSIDKVKLLLSKSTNQINTDNDQFYPLGLAIDHAANGHTELLRLLIEHGAKVLKCPKSPNFTKESLELVIPAVEIDTFAYFISECKKINSMDLIDKYIAYHRSLSVDGWGILLDIAISENDLNLLNGILDLHSILVYDKNKKPQIELEQALINLIRWAVALGDKNSVDIINKISIIMLPYRGTFELINTLVSNEIFLRTVLENAWQAYPIISLLDAYAYKINDDKLIQVLKPILEQNDFDLSQVQKILIEQIKAIKNKEIYAISILRETILAYWHDMSCLVSKLKEFLDAFPVSRWQTDFIYDFIIDNQKFLDVIIVNKAHFKELLESLHEYALHRKHMAGNYFFQTYIKLQFALYAIPYLNVN